MRFQAVAIESLATVVPETRITTASIERMLGRTYRRLNIAPGFLEMLTGIHTRRFWDEGVKPSDAATLAARKALSETGYDASKIGILVNTSVCKDYLEPSTAALVHGNLGLSPACLNFDIGNACLGFLSGMQVVATMIEQGAVEAGLVVAGEGSRDVIRSTVSRLIKPGTTFPDLRDNLATLTLGSAGAAMLLVRDHAASTPHRFLGSHALAATEHSRLCVGTPEQMTTDPTTLLQEGVKLAGRVWAEFTDELGMDHGDFAQYALHQVGKANHDAVCKAVGVPPERALRIYPDTGNVGACGVPLTLARTIELGRVGVGDNVALMGIGSGLNSAMQALRW
jgi:3-oxoacyl-[acyl-carrier-protein] synthase-3